jgi:hypothetical protein
MPIEGLGAHSVGLIERQYELHKLVVRNPNPASFTGLHE